MQVTTLISTIRHDRAIAKRRQLEENGGQGVGLHGSQTRTGNCDKVADQRYVMMTIEEKERVQSSFLNNSLYS